MGAALRYLTKVNALMSRTVLTKMAPFYKFGRAARTVIQTSNFIILVITGTEVEERLVFRDF